MISLEYNSFLQGHLFLHLWAKPMPKIKREVESFCCEGKIGGFHLIPWEDTVLLLANDSMMIANPWLSHLTELDLKVKKC